MKLFDEYPILADDLVCLRRMTPDDAPALEAMVKNEDVYTYLPTFLYEQKYDDVNTVLARMHDECFLTHESLLLGVYLNDDPDTLVGISEIYNYEEARRKASVGTRLAEHVWGRSIATHTTKLMKDYLLNRIGIRIITAHVMVDNSASAAVLLKNGFFVQDVDYHVLEDWGFPEPVVVDKYVFLAYGD